MKRSARDALRLATSVALIAASLVSIATFPDRASAAPPPAIGGCDLFPAYGGGPGDRSARNLTAWNQVVSRSPRDPHSGDYLRRIRALGGNQALHPDFGSNPDYGIPFTTVPGSQPDAQVTIGPDGYPGESDFGPAPIPSNAPVEAGSDRHVLVLQRGACDLYEMYRAQYLGGQSWQADSTAFWTLDSAALRPDGDTSADAAGLPILPGLVRYDEVAAGSVEHAIRVTFERTRRGYVHPATHDASDRCGRFLPPMGLRLRLGHRYFSRHLDLFPPGSQSRPIFRALYRYGLLVVDNGGNFFFTGATDPRWDDDDLNRLKDVPGRAFVVVDSKARVRTPC